MKNLQSVIPTTIYKLRKEQKISRDEMADRLNITSEAYRKIESGTTKITINRLVEICEILQKDIVEIINYGDEKCRIREENSRVTGMNTGIISQESVDKNLEIRLGKIEESIRLLTYLVDKLTIIIPKNP